MKHALLKVINYPSRGADQDIHATFNGFTLTLIPRTTIGQAKFEISVLAQLFGILMNLDGKLARGRKDQRTNGFFISSFGFFSFCWFAFISTFS